MYRLSNTLNLKLFRAKASIFPLSKSEVSTAFILLERVFTQLPSHRIRLWKYGAEGGSGQSHSNRKESTLLKAVAFRHCKI